MRTPQEYSYQLNAINTGLENIDYEIWEFIGKGDINQIDFKHSSVICSKKNIWICKPT